MLFKQMLVYGTRYIQFVFPDAMRTKCVSSSVSNFRLHFQKNKVNFIDFKFSSSYEGPPEYQSDNTMNKFNAKEKNKLKKWIEMIKFEGGRVPQNISEEQYSELLKLESKSSKIKFLHYLSSREDAKMKSRTKKERLKELNREKKEERANRPKGHIEYGLWKNSMFAKTSKQHFRNLQNYRLLNAMLFNQPLIIDLGLYDYMERREVSSLAEQVENCFTKNRLNADPFNLTLCNVDFDCRKFQKIYKLMPNLSKPSFPMNISSESYLDLFPNEKLVYLTPDARDEMEEFDHEAIYIIGGLVNLQGSDPITYTKAKKENIKMMKLPISRYHIRKSNCNLGIHVMVNILLDLKMHGDFQIAFKNIPKRHLYTADDSHGNVYNIKHSKF